MQRLHPESGLLSLLCSMAVHMLSPLYAHFNTQVSQPSSMMPPAQELQELHGIPLQLLLGQHPDPGARCAGLDSFTGLNRTEQNTCRQEAHWEAS